MSQSTSSTCIEPLKPAAEIPGGCGFTLVEYNIPQRFVFCHSRIETPKSYMCMPNSLILSCRMLRKYSDCSLQDDDDVDDNLASNDYDIIINDIFPPKVFII